MKINQQALNWEFMRASGPGGQNVNRVQTAVRLRIVLSQLYLPAAVLRRLRTFAGNKINSDGELIIEASTSRSRKQNMDDAINRLQGLLKHAATRPKKRIETRVSKSQKRKRVDKKKAKAQKKNLRQPPKDW